MNDFSQKFEFDVEMVIEKSVLPTANSANHENKSPGISNFSKISSKNLKNTTLWTTNKPSLEQILSLSKELETFEERAAIIEFDGEQTRKEAEKMAYEALIQKLESCINFAWLTFNKYYNTLH